MKIPDREAPDKAENCVVFNPEDFEIVGNCVEFLNKILNKQQLPGEFFWCSSQYDLITQHTKF